MEEGNIKEHKNYLTMEEEKRKKARVIRETVEGPLLRWISKTVNEKFAVEGPQSSPLKISQASYIPQYTYNHYSASSTPQSASASTPASQANMTSLPACPPAQGLQQAGLHYSEPSFPAVSRPPSQLPAPSSMLPSAQLHMPAEPVELECTVSRNYVVHEIEQEEGATRPPWKSTMSAMFGSNVDWEEMKVYTAKGRPSGMFYS